jgi:hypothetical protein
MRAVCRWALSRRQELRGDDAQCNDVSNVPKESSGPYQELLDWAHWRWQRTVGVQEFAPFLSADSLALSFVQAQLEERESNTSWTS